MRSCRVLLVPLAVLALVTGLFLVAQSRAQEPEPTAAPDQAAQPTAGIGERIEAPLEAGLFLPEARQTGSCEDPPPCDAGCQFANRQECMVQCDCSLLCHKFCYLDGCCQCVC